MKRILIISTVGLLLISLGWWLNDMRNFTKGVIVDAVRLDSLKNSDTLLNNGIKIVKTDTTNEKSNSLTDYETSTYDAELANKLINHRENLKQLSDKKVFSVINDKLTQTLIEKHKEYFKTMVDYELLSVSTGNLFQENSNNDYAFIVYDKKNQRVSILVYNETINKYFELYRDIKVEDGLKNVNCNYTSSGTLDFQIADEIIYRKEYLIKNPESYLELTPSKITNISKDKAFILKSGCFSNKVSKTNLSNSLCIATSSVYNNWECLKYDKISNTFLIFYGQAFAD